MASPPDKLAQSLAALKALQDGGIVAIRTTQLTRLDRERLLKQGFLAEVMKGWYIPARPDGAPGETTAWYASFWAFASEYLTERFGDDWCLGAEQSILLHIENWTVPRQLLVRAPKGGNKPTTLLHETSIFDVRLTLPAQGDVETINGMRVMRLPVALIAAAPTLYETSPRDLQAALAMLSEPADLLTPLLEGGHSTIAGRLAGAYRAIGRARFADTIRDTMRAAGFTVNETNPFEAQLVATFAARETSPAVNRLRLRWQDMRGAILDHFPPAPGLPRDVNEYLHQVEDNYANDAYNSLSIEGYRVSAELIERVRAGNWNPENPEDKGHRDAMAARGYFQAFQAVKQSVRAVLEGQNAGDVVEAEHGSWYRELFAPSVAAGIIRPADLAGYRNGSVFIRHSKHVPPGQESVRRQMPAFFDELRRETEPAVRVVLGHFIFVHIHPYPDGNGRIGRFMMNVMLASGGYPWTVVPLAQRDRYMAALESASVDGDIAPFAELMGGLVRQAGA